jgi:WD40 repeat protein
VGHEKEGYSMAWSPHELGFLVTGSEDKTVKLWDVRPALASKATPGTQISATATFRGHSDMVEDVAWHAKDRYMIGSVGDDRKINLWDTRKPESAAHEVKAAHEGDINCIAFNPVNEFIFATGSADKSVGIWDMRNLSQYVPHSNYTLESCYSPSFSLSHVVFSLHLCTTDALTLFKATVIRSTWFNGLLSTRAFWLHALLIDVSPYGTWRA